MKKAIRYKVLLIVSVFMILTAKAQDYQEKRNTDATLIKINDNSGNEEKQIKCYITYSSYTKKIEVKRAMPIMPEQTDISEELPDTNSFKFDLLFDLDTDEMQENIGSGKIFSTYGAFTYNDSAKDVLVRYSSLPAPVNGSNEFNISFTVDITPEDLKVKSKNNEWVLKVNDATINWKYD